MGLLRSLKVLGFCGVWYFRGAAPSYSLYPPPPPPEPLPKAKGIRRDSHDIQQPSYWMSWHPVNSQHHNTTTSQHPNITASQHRNTTTSHHHWATSQHHNILACCDVAMVWCCISPPKKTLMRTKKMPAHPHYHTCRCEHAQQHYITIHITMVILCASGNPQTQTINQSPWTLNPQP